MHPTKEITMQRRTRWILCGALGALAVGGGASFAIASGGDDQPPITGQALERAGAAALAATGGGRVSETEVGDEDGYYEVEVTLDGGRQVDVHLNRDFTVTSQVADSDTEGDTGRR
jgi:hypothetical protein